MRCSRVHGYYGYFVTDDGTVYSCSFGRFKKLKPTIDNHGYARCHLSKNRKQRSTLVHRLIAEHFIGPIGDLTVNHKNGNKLDNRVDNLEIMSMMENIEHSFANGLCIYPRKPVKQMDYQGNTIAIYSSISMADRETGISKGNISKAVRGIIKQTGGFVWKTA